MVTHLLIIVLLVDYVKITTLVVQQAVALLKVMKDSLLLQIRIVTAIRELHRVVPKAAILDQQQLVREVDQVVARVVDQAMA